MPVAMPVFGAMFLIVVYALVFSNAIAQQSAATHQSRRQQATPGDSIALASASCRKRLGGLAARCGSDYAAWSSTDALIAYARYSSANN